MGGKGVHRGLEVRAPLPDVRAQSQVPDGATCGLLVASRHSSTESSLTGKASGGSGLAALTHTECAS